MRVLVVIAHVNPYKNAQTHLIANAAIESLKEDGHEVQSIDLIDSGFDRVATVDDFTAPWPEDRKFSYLHVAKCLKPEIKKVQEQISWATHIVVVGPMWWFRYPACFDAWMERCLTVGFAFTHEDYFKTGLLKGRKVLMIITSGEGGSLYTTRGVGSIESYLFSQTEAFHFTGMDVLRSIGVYGLSSEQLENEFLPKFRLAIKTLDKRPTLPFMQEPVNGICESQIIAGLEDLTLDEAIAL